MLAKAVLEEIIVFVGNVRYIIFILINIFKFSFFI